jgi:N-carbamoylputrescine amidase
MGAMLASSPIMPEADTLLKIGLAQIDGRLGDLEANVERHLDWIARGREAGVDLLVFPELSLTGYRLLHLTPRVALPATSPVLARLAEAAGSMRVILGFVEEGETGVLHNSAVLLAPREDGDDSEPVYLHRKLYLPTYGIFQEDRFFGAGKRLDPFPLPWGKAGVLICEDLWHPELARRLAAAGVKLLIVISAAPGRIGGGAFPESHEAWELLTRSTAMLNTCWVAYCNRVGWEEGSFYPGVSHLVRPGGEVATRAPILEEHLLVAEIDLRDSDRLRWRLPLLDDERFDIEGPSTGPGGYR